MAVSKRPVGNGGVKVFRDATSINLDRTSGSLKSRDGASSTRHARVQPLLQQEGLEYRTECRYWLERSETADR